MSDALVLGSLPVTSPWCLQGQSWNTTKKREERRIYAFPFWVFNRSWRRTRFIYQCRNYPTKVKCNWESFASLMIPSCLLALPMSGFFASSASSVVKRVFGRRMKIFDLQKVDKEIGDHWMVNTSIQIAFEVWVVRTHAFSHGGPVICCNYRVVTKPSSYSILSSPSNNNTLPSQFVLFGFVAQVVDQSRDTIYQSAVPIGPRLRAQGLIPKVICANWLWQKAAHR